MEFQQIGYSHLKGHNGCPKCRYENLSEIHRNSSSVWVQKLKKKYKGKYSYPKIKTEYIPSIRVRDTFITAICPEHGEFRINLWFHLQNCYCSGCVDRKERRFLSVAEFVAQSREQFEDRFDYSLVEKFKTVNHHVDLICRRHGRFRVTVHNHLKATGGCSKCKMSLGETLIERWLRDHGIEYKKQHFFPDLYHDRRPVTFDFYLPAFNIAIEYDGSQHFNVIPMWGGKKGFEQVKRRDVMRNRYCADQNIRLVRVPYWHRKNIDRNLSREILGTTPRSK